MMACPTNPLDPVTTVVLELISWLQFKRVGEIGLVGTAAAIANAIYHATGKRVHDLPIKLDKLRR